VRDQPAISRIAATRRRRGHVLRIMITHLRREEAYRALSKLLRLSYTVYKLVAPILYRKITFDDPFLVHFFDLIPANGVWKQPARHIDHKNYVEQDQGVRRLSDSVLKLSTRKVALNHRQSKTLGLIKILEIPYRIDMKICTKLIDYLREYVSPFPNVQKAIFGPVVMFEVGLYMRLPKTRPSQRTRHPTMTTLAKLIQPTDICLHLEAPSQCSLYGFLRASLAAHIEDHYDWYSGAYGDGSVSPTGGNEDEDDADERFEERWRRAKRSSLLAFRRRLEKEYMNPAFYNAINSINEFESKRSPTIHGMGEFKLHAGTGGWEEDITLIYPGQKKVPVCRCKGRLCWEDRELVDYHITLPDARCTMGGLLEEPRGRLLNPNVPRPYYMPSELREFNSSRRLTIVGITQMFNGDDGDDFDCGFDAEEDRPAASVVGPTHTTAQAQIDAIKRFTLGKAAFYGYTGGSVRFIDDLEKGGCGVCGLASKDSVHWMRRTAISELWRGDPGMLDPMHVRGGNEGDSSEDDSWDDGESNAEGGQGEVGAE
jgi:hypothetical protein